MRSVPSGFDGSHRSPGPRRRFGASVVVVAPLGGAPSVESVEPPLLELLEQAAAAVTADAARKPRRVIPPRVAVIATVPMPPAGARALACRGCARTAHRDERAT